LIGEHNLKNYCSAILAANVNGISIEDSIESLLDFDGVKRRLENKGSYAGVSIYDDFAHHPTAIRMTTDALSSQHPESKILGIIELGSNTMSGGFHGDELFHASSTLAKTIWIDHKSILGEEIDERLVFNSIDSSLIFIKDNICDYDIILIMTNKDSSLIYNPIIKHLEKI
jgi:UDP-N-acetylmuramate: L-alanyl-gamma-D-glutamyl-meso-diaminopimelate ligase